MRGCDRVGGLNRLSRIVRDLCLTAALSGGVWSLCHRPPPAVQVPSDAEFDRLLTAQLLAER